MAYKSKTCVGCPDAANGCHLACLKVKHAEAAPKRTILDIVKDAGSVFEKYPLAFALATADMEATYYLEGK